MSLSSIHDRIASTAVRDGNTSLQFRDAAQKHANAFWFYLAIGAALWYFVSWVWGVLPIGLAVYVAAQSISSTLVASRLEAWETRTVIDP